MAGPLAIDAADPSIDSPEQIFRSKFNEPVLERELPNTDPLDVSWAQNLRLPDEGDEVSGASAEFEAKIRRGISTVFSISGLNTKDPLDQSLRFFNQDGVPIIDPLMVGKTLVFFSRPKLNFQSAYNIAREPMFNYFASMPMGQKLMGMLMSPYANDSYTKVNLGIGTVGLDKASGLPFKDGSYTPYSPFIPLLSNTCVETSGAKDMIMESYDTQGDYSGNKLSYARGADETGTVSDLSLSFNDIYGGPVSLLFLLWMTYIHDVAKGICRPTSWSIHNREIDYTTSIYIFMLGPDQKTILRFVKYTGCYPTSLSLGQIQHTKDLSVEALRNLSITMRYNRLEYLNPAAIHDFNVISSQFMDISQDKTMIPEHARMGGADSIDADVFMSAKWHRHPYIFGNKLVFTNMNKDVYDKQGGHVKELEEMAATINRQRDEEVLKQNVKAAKTERNLKGVN